MAQAVTTDNKDVEDGKSVEDDSPFAGNLINLNNVLPVGTARLEEMMSANSLNGHFVPNGTWYGSGGWLPSSNIMDDWREDLFTQAYNELGLDKNNITLDNIVNLDIDNKDVQDKLTKLGAIKDDIDKDALKLIKELAKLLQEKKGAFGLISQLLDDAIQQAHQLPDPVRYREPMKGLIKNQCDVLVGLFLIIKDSPPYYTDKTKQKKGKEVTIEAHVVGVPIAALFTNLNATIAGVALFRIKEWNDAIMKIINFWGDKTLETQKSWPQPSKDNKWMSKSAQGSWNVKMGGKPGKMPKSTYGAKDSIWVWPENSDDGLWNSWNEWFAREVKESERPLGSPDNNFVITSCNDGQLFRWRDHIHKKDAFWLKNMPYSLLDIFSGKSVNGNDYSKYADTFKKGKIFQTFLDPNNYHRWWSCVSGTIEVCDVIPGLLASKCVLPDVDGATTASCPYLLEVNSRGIVIIDTNGPGLANIGKVCCVPIGMVDVSSIKYTVKTGDKIEKGKEIGYFAFGGSSSFAIIFEETRKKYNKEIIFCGDRNVYQHSSMFPQDPPPANFNPVDGILINVGEQIAVVFDYNKK